MTTTVPDLNPSQPRKLLLAASTGGHIAQLARLAPGLGAREDSLWVSFDSPQTRSLLSGRRTFMVPYIRPRDWRSTLHAFAQMREAVADEGFDAAVSTGAALALAALPAARLKGIPSLYIESISRVDGPSMSGKALHAMRIFEMRCQHPSWATGRWTPHPSVLDTFAPAAKEPAPTQPLKIFVTLGTIKGYRFDALIDAVLATGLAGDNTTWQLGETRRNDLPGRSTDQMTADDFATAAREADVVVTHAGVGTILNLLEMGIYPVAVVRRKSRGEHVDDHQAQIAGLMQRADIGHAGEADEITAETLLTASGLRVVSPMNRDSADAGWAPR